MKDGRKERRKGKRKGKEGENEKITGFSPLSLKIRMVRFNL